MDILNYNAFWMTLNVSLALIAVVFGWLMYLTKNSLIKILLFGFWLLFIPNTIYILTDVMHIPKQLSALPGIIEKLLLLFQYTLLLIIAVMSFVIALYPLEKLIILHKSTRKYAPVLIFLVNFIIAFGVVMGRMQRTNSWEVFTNLQKVIYDTIYVLTSTQQLLFVLFFGVLGNVLYFLLRKKVLQS